MRTTRFATGLLIVNALLGCSAVPSAFDAERVRFGTRADGDDSASLLARAEEGRLVIRDSDGALVYSFAIVDDALVLETGAGELALLAPDGSGYSSFDDASLSALDRELSADEEFADRADARTSTDKMIVDCLVVARSAHRARESTSYVRALAACTEPLRERLASHAACRVTWNFGENGRAATLVVTTPNGAPIDGRTVMTMERGDDDPIVTTHSNTSVFPIASTRVTDRILCPAAVSRRNAAGAVIGPAIPPLLPMSRDALLDQIVWVRFNTRTGTCETLGILVAPIVQVCR